jgi:hypothetical protein
MTHRFPARLSACVTAAAFSAALFLATGCKSDDQKAIDQAKNQAAATQTPQQVQYIDSNGNTVTTVVQPPVSGQAEQISTTTTPPPPGPKPHSTTPIVTPLGPNGAPMAPAPNQAAYDANGQPIPAGAATQPGPQSGVAAPPANGYPGQPANSGPAPAYSLTVPAGTELAVRVNQRIDVKHAVAGEHFSGEIVEPVTRDGAVLIPRGTPVYGRIDEAHHRGHFKGRSVLELRLVSMRLNGYDYGLDTHDTVRSKKGKGKRSAGFIGGLTGAGMLIGGIASGGVGLAIGGASGAGAGTLLAGATGNHDIVIPAESIVHFRLADQLVVQNP